jgi:hypothetical protein
MNVDRAIFYLRSALRRLHLCSERTRSMYRACLARLYTLVLLERVAHA